MADVVQVTILVLLSLGLISLSALLITVNLSEKAPRHPVFVNFLCTWVAWCAYTWYSIISDLAIPSSGTDNHLVKFQTSLRELLWMSTQVSTLGLVVHLWFTMKTCMGVKSTSHTQKLRTAVLVVTPYLFSLLALIELFRPSTTNPQGADLILGIIFMILTCLTFGLDVILLVTFWRHSRLLRQADIYGVMSMSMIIRLIIFSMYQLVLTAFCGIFLTMSNQVPGAVANIAESLYPLFVFFLLGVKRDILEVWFSRSFQIITIPDDRDRISQSTEQTKRDDTYILSDVVDV